MQEEYRRRRRESFLAIPDHKRALEEALREDLEPGERPEAVSVGRWFGRALTERRLMIARGGWRDRPVSVESFGFDGLRSWDLGWTHDERPFVMLHHPPRLRQEHAPAHRLLWFEWGNRTVSIPRETTRIAFPTRRDPVFRALIRTLEGSGVARGRTVHERRDGSREDRLGGPLVAPYVLRRRRRLLRSERRPWGSRA